jgi:hypothetical protein
MGSMKTESVLRKDLRMALSIGLSAGLIIVLGLPDAVYGPLAVSASLGATVGNSWRLALERILGTFLGAISVEITYHTLNNAVPTPVGVAIGLGLMGLICKHLGLQVGYRVGGIVVVMGYTAHAIDLNQWIPMRIITTLIGLSVALLAINLFWPSRALTQHQNQSKQVWIEFAKAFRERYYLLQNNIELNVSERRERRNFLLEKMIALENLRPDALTELGSDRVGMQRVKLWDLEDLAFSEFLNAYITLMRLPIIPMQGEYLEQLLFAELEVLEAVANRCELWSSVWPWPKKLAKETNGQPPLETEKIKLLSAEKHLFNDPFSQSILLTPTAGRRASLCLQLINTAQKFEAAWAESK